MRRRLNVKAFACLLVLGAVLGAAVHWLHGAQVRRNARSLLFQANLADENKDVAKAIRYLGQYLSFEPHDNDAVFRLAEHLDDQGIEKRSGVLRERAFQLFERGLRHEPERNALRRRQVDTAMALAKYSDALDHINILLEKSPKDAVLHHLAAHCFEGNLKPTSAVEEYIKATSCGPDRLDDYIALARVYRRNLNDRAAANKVMERMTGPPNEKSARAWVMRVQYEMEFEGSAKALDAAKTHMDRARKLAPTDIAVLLADATLTQAVEKPDAALKKARTILLRARDLHPKNAGVYVALVSVEEQDRKSDAALRYADEGLAVLPNNVSLLQAKTRLLINRKRFQEAEEMLGRLRETGASPILVALLGVEILAQQDRWGAALEGLERLRPQVAWLPSVAQRMYELLGKGYSTLGNPDQALAAYQEAVHLDPLSISSRLELAGVLIVLGRVEAALREYSQVLGLPRAPAATRLLLARALIQQNLVRLEKDRDWAPIEQQVRLAAREMPEVFQVAILQAEVLLLAGPQDKKLSKADLSRQAHEMLEKTRDKNPREADIWIALANLAHQNGDQSTALSVLDKANEQRDMKNPASIHLARIGFLGELPVQQARPALEDMEKQVRRLSSSDRQAVLGTLGIAWSRLGQRDEARRLWRALAGEQPNNLGLRILLFDLALEQGQEKEADRWLASIREIEGNRGATWRYAAASRLFQQALRTENRTGGLQRVGELLAEARRLRPSWARVHALQGFLADAENSPDRAIEHYQEAVRLGDHRPAVVRRLVQVLYARGRAPEAEQVVRGMLGEERTLLSANLGQLAAQSLLLLGDMERALDMAHKAVAKNTDISQQLWLAQVLQAAGKKEEANKTLIGVTKQAPQRPEGWIALVRFLINTDRKKEAVEAMTQAGEKLPVEVRSVLLGHCHEALGQPDKAEECYEKALGESKRASGVVLQVVDFYLRKGENSKAVPLLRDLLEKEPKVPEQGAPLVRRILAVSLAQDGDLARFQEAQRLIEKNLASKPTRPEDLRAELLVLSTRSYHRKEAIRKFAELQRQGRLTSQERFALARLYDQDGDWPQAQLQYEVVVSEKVSQPYHLATYARRLIQRNDLDRAEAVVATLSSSEKDSFRTCNLRARLLKARNKDDEALALLRSHMKEKSVNLSLVGHAFENMAGSGPKKELFLREAEAAFRQHADKRTSPTRWLPLAEFYGRQKRSRESLDLCDAALQEKAPPALVAAMMGAVVQNDPQPVLFKRVEKFLTDPTREVGDGAALMAILADLRFGQKKYDEAETLYKRVLRQDESNVVALNNLAWLLAVRHGNVEEGLVLINQAIKKVGPGAELLDTRALVYILQNKPALAVADLRSALGQEKSPFYYYHLAQAYHTQKDRVLALEAWNQARQHGFRPEQLPPLERPGAETLVKALGLK